MEFDLCVSEINVVMTHPKCTLNDSIFPVSKRETLLYSMDMWSIKCECVGFVALIIEIKRFPIFVIDGLELYT